MGSGLPLGVDLGTTCSAAAAIDEAGSPVMIRNSDGVTVTPSVVLFDGSAVLVGQHAKLQRAAFPDDVVEFVKRHMGNPSWRHYDVTGVEYTPEAVSAIILRHVTQDAARVLGEPVREVVVTVPAYFNEAQRTATRQAGEIAGLEVLAICNEPTAAALSFGFDRDYDGTVLVYDLGGGTFDVSLVRMSGDTFDVLYTIGDRNLGGYDFDNAVMEWARDEFAARCGVMPGDSEEAQLRDRAEQVKVRLSQAPQSPMFVTVEGRTEKLVLTRGCFEGLTASLLGRTELLLDEAVTDSGVGYRGVDKVLLVGGSTRMPMVRSMVQRITGVVPDQSVHPDEAVARGAALVADLHVAQRGGPSRRANHRPRPVINDVVSHGLGVVALDDTGLKANKIIIPANARIPQQQREVFFTVVDGQTQLKVTVTEGDSVVLRDVRTIGDSLLTIPAYPAESPVAVVLSCDVDGILHVEVFDLTAGSSLGEFEIERRANLDRSEVHRMSHAVARLDDRTRRTPRGRPDDADEVDEP